MRRIKRKESINYKLIIAIIVVAFFFIISIGYSYLQTQLKIKGKATITSQEQVVSYPKGNSRCTYKIEKNNQTYNVVLNIVNNDEEVNTWNVEFDVPNSIQNIVCNYSCSVNKGRMKIIYKSGNDIIQKGSTKSINFKVDLKNNENFNIKNLTLNGLLVDINSL